MSLIISTGTNLGNREENLFKAKKLLSETFSFVAESKIVESKAVDYLDQPDFLNQCLEFEIPKVLPTDCMKFILDLEEKMGRIRNISKGPRTIDIDIIFWGLETINAQNITVPHESWAQRSFIALPIMDLPYYSVLKSTFNFPKKFNNTCYPL